MRGGTLTYTAPALVELGTLAAHTLTISYVGYSGCKSITSNTDTGFIVSGTPVDQSYCQPQ